MKMVAFSISRELRIILESRLTLFEDLEDIAAPRCFEVESRLKELCDIPVFHDDQHGTAIVVAAAMHLWLIRRRRYLKRN